MDRRFSGLENAKKIINLLGFLVLSTTLAVSLILMGAWSVGLFYLYAGCLCIGVVQCCILIKIP